MEQTHSPARTAEHPGTATRDETTTETIPAGLTRWAQERGALRAFSFVDYSGDFPQGAHRTLTWRRLDQRARAVGARISSRTAVGDRVAILAPQGLDFVIGFLGCLYAGAVAVPMFTPGMPGHSGRLAAVLGDCRPTCVLTTGEAAGGVREYLAEHSTDPRPVVEAVDRIPDTAAAGWSPSVPGMDSVAYLQYTSGSTRTPAGVMITHRNVLANAYQAMDAFAGPEHAFTTVGWLPLFHDMGLVLSVAAPVIGGASSVLMDPMAFLRSPVRWLRLLSQHPRAVSAAPNFAFDFCVSRVPEKERHGLRLDRVAAFINGSEPVRPETIERFQSAFGRYGLAPEAHCPSYGLAEATVFVCSSPADLPPRDLRVDRDELASGRTVTAEAGTRATTRLAGCGIAVGQEVRVVDPETGVERPAGQVGEIWIQGPNVGIGYWGRAEQSAEVFGARLRGPDGAPLDGTWLRTGDLGAFHEGELLVTGRRKDLIIIDGRNHYPQDIEVSAQEAHPAIRREHVAAFSVASGTSEALVVVAEHSRRAPDAARDPVTVGRAVRETVAAAHGVTLTDFILVAPGMVPRTTSGKVSRSACRERYLGGEFVCAVGSPA